MLLLVELVFVACWQKSTLLYATKINLVFVPTIKTDSVFVALQNQLDFCTL